MRAEQLISGDGHRRHECLFAALSLSAVLLFTLFVLSDSKVSLAGYLQLAGAYVAITPLILVSAFICFAGQAVVQAGAASKWKTSPADAVRSALLHRWREDRLFSLAWPLLLFILLMPSFNAFKQRILPDAGFALDAELAAIDRSLFGTDPGIWLHQAIGSPAATAFFDAIYHSWFVPTTLGLCIVGLCASVRTRAQYMLSYVGVWILLGAVLAYAMPAAGPAFYDVLATSGSSEPFRAVHSSLVATASDGTFLTSLYNQAYLLRNLDQPEMVVGGGISAIPSVHNAIAVLFALAAFRVHRSCGLAMSGFALLIWIGSVYLNWHYAIDGIVGAAGAAVLWYGSGALVDWILRDRRAAAEAVLPQPELA